MALWYVCHTKPNAERRVSERLVDQVFRTYLPMLTGRRAANGRVYESRSPLFPGYLFVELETVSDDRWKSINNTRGVLTLLPSTERPVPIATSIVNDLRRDERLGLFKTGVVRAGERVKVFRGSLSDQILECIESKHDRIKCLWNCFGAQRVVEVPIQNVQVLR